MKKSKIFMSLVASLPVITSLTGVVAVATGCACKKEEGKIENIIPTSMLDISGDTLKGFKDGADISKYTTLEIPSSINTISANAFNGKFPIGSCVNTVKFSNNIRKIGAGAFANCPGITNVDLSQITEDTIKLIDFGSNIFGSTNQPEYINVTFNNDLSKEAKEELIRKLINAGFPEACFVEKTTGHVTAVKETQDSNTAAVAKNEFVIEATSTDELFYTFVATANRDGGTPGVGVKLGEVVVTRYAETNTNVKFKATVAAEIVNAKNNGDYVTYKVDMIAKNKQGEIQWIQTIENFKIVYNVDVVSICGIEANCTLLNPSVGTYISTSDLVVNAKYSDGTKTPVQYGLIDGYIVYDENDKAIFDVDSTKYKFESTGTRTFTIRYVKDNMSFSTKVVVNVEESPYVELPGIYLTNIGDTPASIDSVNSFGVSQDGEQWSKTSSYTLEPFHSVYICCKYVEDNNIIISGGKVHLTGNCMTLLLDSNGNVPAELPADGCLKAFFKNSDGIVSVSSKFLPKTKLTNSCYESMFEGCVNLATAPNLPAEELKTDCYKLMFNNCASLPIVEAGNTEEENRIFTCRDNSYCADMFKGTKTGGDLFTGTPNKNYTYYYLDQVSKQDFLNQYNTFFDSYVATYEEKKLDTVTAGPGSKIEGVSVSGEQGPVTYDEATHKATAKFPSCEDTFALAGISKQDFADIINTYAQDCDMYFYADASGLIYMAVSKTDPSKCRIVRMSSNTYVKYCYDTLVGSKETEISITWSDEEQAAETGGDKVRIMVWNDEFPDRFKRYFSDEKAAGLDTYHLNEKEVEFVQVTNQDGAYQLKLDELLLNNDDAGEDDKIDIFVTEGDYIAKYTDSEYTLDLTDIGVDPSLYDNAYQYVTDVCTNRDGVLKGSSWQICPSVFIYRRSIAKGVLGTDDPATISGWVEDVSGLSQTGADLKAKDYKLLMTRDGIFRSFRSISGQWITKGEDGNDVLTVPQGMLDNLKTEGVWADNGYFDKNTGLWSSEANQEMYLSAKSLGEFGPDWFINFCMPHNVEGIEEGAADGDWAVCPGISNCYWGGSFINVAKGSDNPEEERMLFERMADPEILLDIAYETGDLPNNQEIMQKCAEDSKFDNAFLGGQNPYDAYHSVAANMPTQYKTIYDSFIDEKLAAVYKDYLESKIDWDTMLVNFYTSVKETYPDLTINQ